MQTHSFLFAQDQRWINERPSTGTEAVCHCLVIGLRVTKPFSEATNRRETLVICRFAVDQRGLYPKADDRVSKVLLFPVWHT